MISTGFSTGMAGAAAGGSGLGQPGGLASFAGFGMGWAISAGNLVKLVHGGPIPTTTYFVGFEGAVGT